MPEFLSVDLVWIVVGAVLIVAGIIGCIAPIIPGPPVSYLALLVLQLKANPPFSLRFLIIWGTVVVLVTVLDYIVPIIGTKKFGGTKYGVWGSTIGLIIGLFCIVTVISIILGPFVGAVIGELIGGKNLKQSLIAGLGAFIGFITGVVMKLAVSLIITVYFIINII